MDRTVRSEVADDFGIEEEESNNFVTTFEFDIGNENDSCSVDSDGDFEVPRKKKLKVKIEHRVSTSVADCGEQVWRGGLAASKYLIKNKDRIKGKKVLELGAGTGFTSIIASWCGAELVVATDLKDRLESMRSNFNRNSDLTNKTIQAAKLDLLKKTPENVLDKNWDFVIGADVAYDDDLSSGVIDRCKEIADSHIRRKTYPPDFVFCLEKRFNFTLEAMSVVAHAYDAFVSRLKQVFNDTRENNQYFVSESVFADGALHPDGKGVFKETLTSYLMIVLVSSAKK